MQTILTLAAVALVGSTEASGSSSGNTCTTNQQTSGFVSLAGPLSLTSFSTSSTTIVVPTVTTATPTATTAAATSKSAAGSSTSTTKTPTATPKASSASSDGCPLSTSPCSRTCFNPFERPNSRGLRSIHSCNNTSLLTLGFETTTRHLVLDLTLHAARYLAIYSMQHV